MKTKRSMIFIGCMLILCVSCEKSGTEAAQRGRHDNVVEGNMKPSRDREIGKILRYENIRVNTTGEVKVLSENRLPYGLIKSKKYDDLFGNRQSGITFQSVQYRDISGTVTYVKFPSQKEAQDAYAQYQRTPANKPATVDIMGNYIILIQVNGHDVQELDIYSKKLCGMIVSEN